MNFLPSEILFEIFQHLEAHELCDCAAVCRAFNDVISGSSKLTQQMQLSLRKLNGIDESIVSRVYTKMKIGFFKAADFHLLENIGEKLADISFKNYKLRLDIIRRILMLTPNVKELKFEQVLLSDVPNVLKQPTPQLVNLSLTSIESDPRVFKVLEKCSLNELKLLHSSKHNFHNFTCLNKLLCSQTSLKRLTIEGLVKTSLFGDGALDNVGFKLQSITLRNSLFQRTVHLKNFLKSHEDTLEEMEIANIELCDLSMTLNNAHRLKSLKLSKTSLNYLETSASVEELALAGQKINEQSLERFPHVTHLKLKSMRNKSLLDALSRTMKLNRLEVADGSIELSFPTVKFVTLSNTEHDPIDFFKRHTSVEELTLINCWFVNDAFIEAIVKFWSHLTLLILRDCGNISNSSLEAINKNCNKLEKIRISNCGDNLNWKIFKSLKLIHIR
jgi:dihydroneopterin aldolase